jgi:hypothetical protein
MTNQDLTQQWLAEINSLKQQMAQLQRERDEAWESSQKWRQLYNTEAEQRRTDAQMSQQAIASVKSELQKLRGLDEGKNTDGAIVTAIQQEIAELKSVEEFQAKIIALVKERDRLLQALKTEQDSHMQTRKSLTTALGDAIDSLARERSSVGKEVVKDQDLEQEQDED